MDALTRYTQVPTLISPIESRNSKQRVINTQRVPEEKRSSKIQKPSFIVTLREEQEHQPISGVNNSKST